MFFRHQFYSSEENTLTLNPSPESGEGLASWNCLKKWMLFMPAILIAEFWNLATDNPLLIKEGPGEVARSRL